MFKLYRSHRKVTFDVLMIFIETLKVIAIYALNPSIGIDDTSSWILLYSADDTLANHDILVLD